MSTFLSRYLDSLTITPGSGRIPGRARVGYSFGERYWASLTRAKLWSPEHWPSREGLASLGRAIADQAGIDADKAEEVVAESIRERLY